MSNRSNREERSQSALGRRDFLRLGALGAAGLALGRPALAAQAGAAGGKRPNVIVILTDDQGYADFSCHGNPVLKTPNMDRLHDESVRFTDFHVAPMCTPTRSQLMTGQDCLHNGASSVCAGRSMIRPGIPTMAEIFAANGYRTAHFGKWHLGDSYPNLPHQKGFQESVHLLGWGITSMADLWCNDYFDGRFRHNGELKQYPGYCTDTWFRLAMDWLRQRQADGAPFFLYLPTNAPHGPLWVDEKYSAPYAEKAPPAVAQFFGMLANLDENLGKLLEMLKASGLEENTIVILMTDNGGTAGVKFYNAGMRAGKTTYYDGGHRAACFVRWPAGGLRKPADVGELAQNQDILPTLVELCGLKTPEGARFDGASLAPLLKGTAERLPERMLVVQYGQKPEKWDCAVMWGKWRLVGGKELYNLAEDPGQQRDLAAASPDVAQRMRAHYEQWWAGVEPKINDFVPVVVGAEEENPVTLSAADWANTYCDNMKNLRAGLSANAPWNIRVARDGEYEIALRRWPREADAPIAGGVPAFKARRGELPEGRALPVAKARLRIPGVIDESRPVQPGDKEVVFRVRLKGGVKTELQTYFYGPKGRELCGAYFTTVRRV